MGIIFIQGGRMSFQIQDEELQIDYKGKKHSFRSPSVIEHRKLSKQLKELSTNPDSEVDAFDVYVEFYKSLGVPSEICEKLSAKQIIDLLNYILGTKKN